MARLVASFGGVAFLTFLEFVSGQNKQPGKQPDGQENIRLIASIEGPNLYKAYCAVCHGPAGKGNGPMSMFLKTQPSDLTRIQQRNNGIFPRAQVRRIISGEEPVPAGHGTRDMPVWGPIFSQVAWDQDLGRVRIDNLGRYLETLQVK